MRQNSKHLFLYILAHPFDGFYDMRRRKAGKKSFIILIYFLFALLGVFEFRLTGFIFNKRDQSDFNLFRIMILTVLPYFLFIIANYSVANLVDGKGFLPDIVKTIGYALVPLIFFRGIALVLSRVLTQDEAAFYYLLIGLGYFFMFFYALIGLIVVHEFTLTKVLITLVLSVAAMAIIIFIGILLLTLFQQLLGFITSILKELRLR